MYERVLTTDGNATNRALPASRTPSLPRLNTPWINYFEASPTSGSMSESVTLTNARQTAIRGASILAPRATDMHGKLSALSNANTWYSGVRTDHISVDVTREACYQQGYWLADDVYPIANQETPRHCAMYIRPSIGRSFPSTWYRFQGG